MYMLVSPRQICCDGCKIHHVELGFNKLSFTLRTGLVELHLTYLPIIPLYYYAIVPFGFPRQVK
jgi:hypothetical protein